MDHLEFVGPKDRYDRTGMIPCISVQHPVEGECCYNSLIRPRLVNPRFLRDSLTLRSLSKRGIFISEVSCDMWQSGEVLKIRPRPERAFLSRMKTGRIGRTGRCKKPESWRKVWWRQARSWCRTRCWRWWSEMSHIGPLTITYGSNQGNFFCT